MPHRQHHRGLSPEDPRLFDEASLVILRQASEEARYLLDRGYSTASVLDVVSRRHELRERQRSALQRSLCSSAAVVSRQSRVLSADQLSGCPLELDGFNVVIWIEVALSGGVVLKAADGAYRDLAGLRGSYHPVEETEAALVLLGGVFAELDVAFVRFYLDEPVSNSGRLKTRILAHAAAWPLPVEVQLVRDPDRELYGKSFVVTSDSAVLDRVKSWFNLPRHLIENRLVRPYLCEF